MAKYRTVFVLGFCCFCLAWTFDRAESFRNVAIAKAVLAATPSNWKVVQRSQAQVPFGHYWGTEYQGQGGEFIVLEGPQEVSFHWTNREDGRWHEEPLAREVLELWIMPPDYSDTWQRFLHPHRPFPATLIYSGASGKIYGHPSHRITSRARFDELLGNASKTAWPTSPHNGGPLSWPSWEQDLAKTVKASVGE